MINKRKSIKSKIIILFLAVLSVFWATTIFSVTNLKTLSTSIDDIMQANYKSVVAAQNMTVAIERQDSALLSYLFTGDAKQISFFKQNEAEFMRWYAIAEDNITETGESEIIQGIYDSYIQYLEKFTLLTLIKATESSDEARSYYFNEILPLFELTKEQTRELLNLNQDKMLTLKDNAIKMADRAIFSTIIIPIVTSVVTFFLAIFYVGKLVSPISALINKVKAVAEGDYTQRLDFKDSGEVSVLADEFNTMAEKIHAFELLNVKRIMEEKRKAEAMVESINDGIILTDIEHRIVLVNKAAEKAFDIKERDVINKHFLESLNNEEIFERIKIVEQPGKRPKDVPKDFIYSKKSSEEKLHFRVQVIPIFDKDKGYIGAVTLIQDITKLKEVDNLKSEFVSTVSHEFRTPLTSISMGVGLLLEEVPGKLTDGQKELIQAIKEDEERLKNLVNDLLDLSKIESGKIKMDIQSNSIDNIIADSIKPLMLQAKEKNISLNKNVESDLPNVQCDYNKITWVITNLLGNALRYTPKDGSGLIVVEAKRLGNKVLVAVQDNGKGIPYEYRKRIFDKFIQVQDEGDSSGGTGLGLAICKEIVNAHGGRIWVKSEPGNGSTFYFTIYLEK